MKLRQLQFTREIARTGSFSLAAGVCNATQPTLSSAISQLEEELGSKLFARTTRQVELTPFGRHMLPYVEAVLGARDELEKAAEGFLNPAHKVLRIGFSPLVDVGLLDFVLAPFREAHPEVQIFFKECLLDDLSGRLAEGSVDLAVVPSDMVAVGQAHLSFYDDPLFYVPKDGDPELGAALRLQDLPEAPVILTGGGCGLTGALDVLFGQEDMEFNRYPGAAISYQAIEDWAGLGIGAGILPKAKITTSRDRAVPLMRRNGTAAMLAFDWVWRQDLSQPPHMAALLDDLRNKVPALVAGRDVTA